MYFVPLKSNRVRGSLEKYPFSSSDLLLFCSNLSCRWLEASKILVLDPTVMSHLAQLRAPSISLVTCDLNCCVSFYPGYCLFQDLVTQKIIGKGHKSKGLYNFYHQVSTSSTVACSGIVSPFDAHCCLGHSSLSILRNLYPQFYNLSSLNCASCQFAKFHRLSSSSRVDKRANSPFELVHSDIWGLCSTTGFR